LELAGAVCVRHRAALASPHRGHPCSPPAINTLQPACNAGVKAGSLSCSTHSNILVDVALRVVYEMLPDPSRKRAAKALSM